MIATLLINIRYDLALQKISLDDAKAETDLLLTGGPFRRILGSDLMFIYEKVRTDHRLSYGIKQLSDLLITELKKSSEGTINIQLKDQLLKMKKMEELKESLVLNHSGLKNKYPEILRKMQVVEWILPKEDSAYLGEARDKLVLTLNNASKEERETTALMNELHEVIQKFTASLSSAMGTVPGQI